MVLFFFRSIREQGTSSVQLKIFYELKKYIGFVILDIWDVEFVG